MTYLSKPQAFLSDKAKELVGRIIVCQRDAGAGYFTKGKEYEIHIDGTECPYILSDFGGHCHQSASTFVLKHSLLTPKLPKAGEVWCFMKNYNNPKSLWVVRTVDTDEEIVVTQNIVSGYKMSRNIEGFLKTNTFVF